MTNPSVQFGSNELCLLWKGDQYGREKFLYLKGSSIGWKKFERAHPEPFLTAFQFLWGILVLVKALLLMTKPSARIGSKWTVSLAKGCPMS